MRKPTRKEIHNYEHNIAMNSMFRDVDQHLAVLLTPDERLVVMTTAWPAIQDIATVVIKRTISDLTKGGR